MTNAASALRAAAFCLFAPVGRWEIDEGIDWVEAAIDALSPGTNPDLVKMIETLDYRLLEFIADELESKERAVPSISVETKDDVRPSFPARKRQRKARLAPPDGLRTKAEAAVRLGCSIKTLNGHVAAGALRYIAIGHGTKRPRKMFTDNDLDQFIAAQTRKDSPPCPSTASRARHTSTSISNSTVIDFTAPRRSRPSVKPKK